MKNFLDNKLYKTNITGRLLSVLIACCILMQTGQPCLRAFASETTEDPAFNVPCGGDVKGYDPLEDGYYAYLKVKYEDIGVPVSEKGKAYVESYLPVLVYQDHLLMDIDYFTAITGAEQMEKDSPSGDARIRLNVFQRYVFLSENNNTLYYFLGNDEDPLKWIDQNAFILDVAPQKIDGNLYIPFIDIMGILQINFSIVDKSSTASAEGEGEKYLQIERPKKNVYDVLGEIKSDGDSYYFTYGDADLRVMGATASACASLHGMLQGDWRSWVRVLAAGTIVFADWGEDVWDDKQCEELVKLLMNVSKNEGELIDQINASNAVEMTQYIMNLGLPALNGAAAMSAYYDTLDMLLDQGNSPIVDCLIKSSRAFAEADIADFNEFVGKIDSSLSTVSDALLVMGVVSDFAFNFVTYCNRDLLASQSLYRLFSDECEDKYRYTLYHLGEERLANIEKTSSQISQDPLAYASKRAFLDNLGNIIEQTLNTGNPASFLYRIFYKYIPFVGHIEEAESFNTSMYAIPFQFDTRNAALNCIDQVRISTSDDAELMDAIELGYIYLKSCYVARECAAKALTKKDEKKELGESISFWNDKNYAIAENLAVLSAGYPSGTDTAPDCLPPTALECHSYNFTNHKEDQAKELLIPLYMKVTGQVRERNAEETPVTDAICSITCGDEETGSFEGTEDGSFSVYVPVMKAEEVLESIETLENMVLSFNFTSPTVEGKGSATAEFEPKGEIDLGTIYLKNFDWYIYIRDELAPMYGYADMDQASKKVDGETAFNADSGMRGWVIRDGIAGADVLDMTGDGNEDLLLYRFEPDEYALNGYNLLVDFYVENDGNVTLNGRHKLSGSSGASYISCRVGIITVEGTPYLWCENNSNAYFANGSEFWADFYGCDHDNLVRRWMNGKTDGGSSDIAYSLVEYSDNNIDSKNVLYGQNGPFLGKILSEDSVPGADCESPGTAVEEGYNLLGLPEAARSEYPYSDWTIYDIRGVNDRNIFPTYWETDTVKKSLEMNTSGEYYASGYMGGRYMTDTVTDFTDLMEKVQ